MEHLKIFTENIEPEAVNQVYTIAKSEIFKDSVIRIMPDVHAGKGCTIGTTITIKDKIVPNLVGVDIGCGVDCIEIDTENIDFKKLDEVIHQYVPAGFNIHEQAGGKFKFEDLRCCKQIDLDRPSKSIGTLGGGNHFIEIDYSPENHKYYLLIHSGSRNLGVQVCKHYQNVAVNTLGNMKGVRDELIAKLKSQHREKEIFEELKKLQKPALNKDLAYLTDKNFDDYMHDMQVTQDYAVLNRRTIAENIIKHMNWKVSDKFSSIHNYIDMEHKILRKGAISAQRGELAIIPINMKEGSLICRGKGNEDWNYSAPHGAGRIMSRAAARENIALEDYEKSMEGIYTTSVNMGTIDESYFVYKNMEEIASLITPTVDILDKIVPIYNFKAGE